MTPRLTDLLSTRYTTKAFDPSFKLTPEQIEQLRQCVRMSPSSVNSQPWHVLVAETPEALARVAKACAGNYTYNGTKLSQCSCAFVLCTRASLDDAHLLQILEQETRDGRFPTEQARTNQQSGRAGYARLHRFDLKDTQAWMEKQVYIALGFLLMGAAQLGIDACPMEGFHAPTVNDEFGLREKGYTATVIVAFGRHSSDDFNKNLPKSRLPAEQMFTSI